MLSHARYEQATESYYKHVKKLVTFLTSMKIGSVTKGRHATVARLDQNTYQVTTKRGSVKVTQYGAISLLKPKCPVI